MALFSRVIFHKYTPLARRSFHTSYALRDEEFKKLKFRLDGYYKFGLLADDILDEYHQDVKEAIRRLPEDELMQRKYRAIRAMQAELNNSILPKEQWTKYDDNHRYLHPYIEEVRKEREEREKWEANH